MTKQKGLLIFLHCVLPLLAGAAVYLFLRPVNFLSRFFNFNNPVIIHNKGLQQFFFTFPDFCWSYSLSCALYLFAIWYRLNLKTTALPIFILVVGSEVVQLFFLRYFTFDVFDLVAAVLAFVLSSFQMKKIAYEKEAF